MNNIGSAIDVHFSDTAIIFCCIYFYRTSMYCLNVFDYNKKIYTIQDKPRIIHDKRSLIYRETQ